MPDRIFRLMERYQLLDEFLRRALMRRFADPVELARLRVLKLRTRQRLTAALGAA